MGFCAVINLCLSVKVVLRDEASGKEYEAMTCPVVLVVCGDKKQSKPIVFAEDLAFSFEPASEETFPIHVRTSLRCAALAYTRRT